MKRSINILVYLSLLIATASCSKWLDVGPSNQTGEGDLFKEGQGYEVALNGIYQILASPEVYGRTLSWGMLSAMGQDYATEGDTLSISKAYRDAAKYDYTTDSLTIYMESAWSNMYNAVANCNNLLQNIEGADPEIFEFKQLEKNVIKGEALALRAMVHFDLLRLFAPSPAAAEAGRKYLPYNKVHPTLVGMPLTVGDFMNNVIEDFKAGMELTATMDTLPEYNAFVNSIDNRLYGYGGVSRFFQYRSTRLNYYTITTLLARAQLYAGDTDGALESASILDSLIDNNSGFKSGYKFTPSYNLSYSDVNRRYIKSPYDVIFALFNNNQILLSRRYYGQDDGSAGYLALRKPEDLFAGETQDHRYRYLMMQIPEAKGSVSLKWYPSNDYQIARSNHPLIPMMRLGELYLIISECLYDKDPAAAFTYLNAVRGGRGVYAQFGPEDVDGNKANFLKLVRNEMIKEYMAEGQSFFTNKRLNMTGSDVHVPVGGRLDYVVPVPASNNVF